MAGKFRTVRAKCNRHASYGTLANSLFRAINRFSGAAGALGGLCENDIARSNPHSLSTGPVPRLVARAVP